MSELRILKKTLFDSTKTTEIIDEFIRRDEHGKRMYDRLILTRGRREAIIRYEKEDRVFPISYVIEFPVDPTDWYSDRLFDVTMSDIKNRRMYSFNNYVKECFSADDMEEYSDLGKIAFLKQPFLLRAQTSFHKNLPQLGEQYGETMKLAIVGVKPKWLFLV